MMQVVGIVIGSRTVDITIRVLQGTSDTWHFEFVESEDFDAVRVDPSTFVDVRMDLFNDAGAKMLSFRIGAGFEIKTSEETGRKELVLDKAYTEYNLPAGKYRGDMLVVRNSKDASKPLNVLFIFEKTFTTWA